MTLVRNLPVKKIFKTEAQLQEYAVKTLKGTGCLVYKFSSQAKRGVPDLAVINTNGRVLFIELKHPNGQGRLSKLQELEIEKMRKNNVDVFVLNKVSEIDKLALSLKFEALVC